MTKTRDQMPQYDPSPEDIQWARQQLALIAEGGAMVFPQARLIYRVYHKTKVMVLENPEQIDACFTSFCTHQQSIAVFGQVGYAVMEKVEQAVFDPTVN